MPSRGRILRPPIARRRGYRVHALYPPPISPPEPRPALQTSAIHRLAGTLIEGRFSSCELLGPRFERGQWPGARSRRFFFSRSLTAGRFPSPFFPLRPPGLFAPGLPERSRWCWAGGLAARLEMRRNVRSPPGGLRPRCDANPSFDHPEFPQVVTGRFAKIAAENAGNPLKPRPCRPSWGTSAPTTRKPVLERRAAEIGAAGPWRPLRPGWRVATGPRGGFFAVKSPKAEIALGRCGARRWPAVIQIDQCSGPCASPSPPRPSILAGFSTKIALDASCGRGPSFPRASGRPGCNA